MNIVVIGADVHHYQNSMVKAIEKKEHKVLNLINKDFKLIEKSWKVRLVKWGIKSIEHRWEEKRADLHLKKIKLFGPDLILVINGMGMTQKLAEFIIEKKVRALLMMIDSLTEPYCKIARDYLFVYDKIFSYESTDVTLFKDKCKSIRYLPVGYEDTIFYPSSTNSIKDIDISFVGSLDVERISKLEEVAAYAETHKYLFLVFTLPMFKKGLFSKWGRTKFYKKNPHLSKCIIDKPVCNGKLADIYRRSKICINLHQSGENHTDVNPRTFEILACKGFELVDKGHMNNIKLIPDLHLVEFDKEKELIEKIDFFLKNSEKRETIAQKGYILVEEYYSMKVCMEEVLSSL